MTLIRWPNAHFELRKDSLAGGQALVGTRSIFVSPLPNESGVIYVTGYDANKALAHKTAWIGRAVLFFWTNRNVRFGAVVQSRKMTDMGAKLSDSFW